MEASPVPAAILVVDDLVEKHRAYRASLADIEQEVVQARSGEEALRLLVDRDFAVILLDVHMPGMCGHETAARIRKLPRSRHTPIIFVTSFADEVQTSEGYALGAVDYILSPIVPDILRAKVRVFVELYQMRAELAQSHANLEQRVQERTEELARSAEILRVEVGERKRAEERLKILVSELTHRVKNLLAVLQSITTRTLTEGRSVGECRGVLLGRLHALARAHELLTESYWKGADIGDIVEAEVSGFSDRVHAKGPPVLLSGSAVQTFALVIHELATNAAKYGALSNSTGSVEIDWALTSDGAQQYLDLRWKELGGPPVSAVQRKGFGLMLISTMAGAYTAPPLVDFAPDGLICRIRLPLETVAAQPDNALMPAGKWRPLG